jgi:hypothetical protein
MKQFKDADEARDLIVDPAKQLTQEAAMGFGKGMQGLNPMSRDVVGFLSWSLWRCSLAPTMPDASPEPPP